MKNLMTWVGGGVLGILLVLLVLALTLGVSWIATCGVVALICLCFSLEFSWLIATGIWLVLGLLAAIFKR